MKRFMSGVILSMLVMPVMAATPAGAGRRSTASQWMAAPRTVPTAPVAAPAADMADTAARATASVNQLNAWSGAAVPQPVESVSQSAPVVDQREAERAACLANNIGVGNTFVWASRYSNTANYATMVEDVDNPANNVCFVRVELKSDDAKVSVSDVPAVYYEMGRTITCGEWADGDKIKDRILASKKKARTWGTVAGAVGGAGIGVGAMELFGNHAIGGAVEGQADLRGARLVRSKLLEQGIDSRESKEYLSTLRTLKEACESDDWRGNESQKPEACNDWNDYFDLLNLK
ncbi:hypothetical protein HDR63_01395 [bacterium]|nr:hypothetical protein [bacterium]